ncbi:Leucine-rich repeat-containing N-terminal, plant-type [Dillenia turbinata]|uniref:Leucine-rich repeat-containing N-terminal, plant-type n=1 Tax=Dillenia turbinata TaxID=194707 RepID=A0AAN8V7G8_9MAGN
MGFKVLLLSFILFSSLAQTMGEKTELRVLMEIKESLDPEDIFLSSWTPNGDPCSGSFEGLACNENKKVTNISLQGKGLTGRLSPAIAGLKHLTGLYLHYNSLSGELPKEISNLTQLSDLYLNVNNLSGSIPSEIGSMPNLQVLQLCYNQFTGSVPNQLGSLKNLVVLALQSNNLRGAIPASLGDLGMLVRLDLSFNHLFGSIPSSLANAPMLQVFDVRNNTLSGNVPPALKRLNEGFQFENNLGLCGAGFMSLRTCNASDGFKPSMPEPYGAGTNGPLTRNIPETADLNLNCTQSKCLKSSRGARAPMVVGLMVVTAAVSTIGILTFSQYRRRKQKLGDSFGTSESRPSIDQTKDIYRKNGSPLISLEYSHGWDPLSDVRNCCGLSQELFQSYRFNLEEVESATQYFSDANLLGKSNFSAIFKGTLRDGSFVAIKSINKTSCKSEESEFLKGLNILTSLKHENILRLRGICCSRGRGECFLIYDFVPNGSLLRYLDLMDGDAKVLEWSTRVSIINGIARGIGYLHEFKVSKPALVHQNISADKILIDQKFNPLISDCGLHKLLANDIVFSALKASAAMGYLAPEYTTTGRFTNKSDVYAFGVLVFQILSGRKKFANAIQFADSNRYQDFIDPNLHGKFSEQEAAKLVRIALNCTHESPYERPPMETVIQELGDLQGLFLTLT